MPYLVCTVLVWCSLVLQCAPRFVYTPDPEQDIDDWVQAFAQQRSFRYRYILKTEAVTAEASGACVIGRGEHIEGVWRDDTSVSFEYIGLGDQEWSREDGTWVERVRGEQSDFLAQITRVFAFDKFEYRGFENGYIYDFKATVPFLSPDGWKKIRGVLRISDKTFLPDDVWVGLPDSSVFWHMEISHYNQNESISAPVENSTHYTLLGISQDFRRTVDQRLDLLGIEHRVNVHDGTVVLTVPQQYHPDDMRTILSEKHLVMYEVTGSPELAIKVGYLYGDESKPVYFVDTFATVQDIKNVRIEFDPRSRPFLEIALREKQTTAHSIGCEVNGVTAGIATLDTPGKIDRIHMYTSMSYFELQVLRAALLEPLPSMQMKTATEGNN